MHQSNTTLAVVWNPQASCFGDMYALEGRFFTGETAIIGVGGDLTLMLGLAERVKKGHCPGDLSLRLHENKVTTGEMATALVICEIDELIMPNVTCSWETDE